MSQDKGNDMRLEDSSQDKGTVTSPKATIEDKLNDFIHLVADGWGTEFYDLGRVGKHTTLLDLIERCEADIRKELQAIITTETTKAREDELEKAVQQFIFNTKRNPDNFSEYATARLAALQKEQKR